MRRGQGEGGDDEAVPAEQLEAVLVQVADEPAHRDDRGDERDDEADERVQPAVRVDELAAVLQRLERGRRGERREPEQEAELQRGRHREAERERGEDRHEAAARSRPQREDLRDADDRRRRAPSCPRAPTCPARPLAEVSAPRTRITMPPTIHAAITGPTPNRWSLIAALERDADDRRRNERDRERDEDVPAVLVAADESRRHRLQARRSRARRPRGWRRPGS